MSESIADGKNDHADQVGIGLGTSRSARGINRCPICDYDFVTLPDAYRCPECGFEYDEHTQVWPCGSTFFTTRAWRLITFVVTLLVGFKLAFGKSATTFTRAVSIIPLVTGVYGILTFFFSPRGRALIVVSPNGFYCRTDIPAGLAHRDWESLAKTDLAGLDAAWTRPVTCMRATNLVAMLRAHKMSLANRSDIRRALEEGLMRYHSTESTDRAREEAVEQANQSE